MNQRNQNQIRESESSQRIRIKSSRRIRIKIKVKLENQNQVRKSESNQNQVGESESGLSWGPKGVHFWATVIIILYTTKNINFFRQSFFLYSPCYYMRAWIRVLDAPGCYERAALQGSYRIDIHDNIILLCSMQVLWITIMHPFPFFQ